MGPDNNARKGLVPNATIGVLTPVALGSGVAGLLISGLSRTAMNFWGHPTGIAEAFSSPTQHIRGDFGTARFDANLSANDLLFAVYTLDDSVADTPTQDPYSLVDESLREQVASVQEQHVSPRLLNTGRIGLSRANSYFGGSILATAIQVVTPTFLPGKPTGAVASQALPPPMATR